MFGSLAQLSENFIFIYLGLSLFTQTQLVYKPMFILVTAVRSPPRHVKRARARLIISMTQQFAVCIARYCAVFPISKAINVFYKARGSRSDELPHSYQMMLFWAGLRGAVGVALAEGMKGENAVALRTTVLVSVVLTVVVFGGTIGRMIEILGIRTGVEEDDGESSDEEDAGGYSLAGGLENDLEGRHRHSKRRSYPLGNRPGGGFDLRDRDGDGLTVSSGDSPYRDRIHSTSSIPRIQQQQHPLNSFRTASAPTSDHSNSSEDSDPDVLPTVGADAAGDKEGDLTRVWRDGQWFTVLDERYLLPVFSNATASRRQASKKAMLRAKRSSFAVDRTADEGLDGDERNGSAPNSPYLGGGGRQHREVNPSFSVSLSLLSSFLFCSQWLTLFDSAGHPLLPGVLSTTALFEAIRG